jgi:P27 family predicted phage terminase small subunit
MGRPPKPNVLKLLDGNPGKRPLPNAVDLPRGLPGPPAFLDKIGRKTWRRLVPMLESLGLDVATGYYHVVLYCQWSSIGERAWDELRSGPLSVDGQRGPTLHPAITVLDKATAKIVLIGREFGLTPSAASRIALPSVSESDPFAEFA